MKTASKITLTIAVAAGVAWALHRKRQASQEWFWGPDWHPGEREVDQHLRDGNRRVFDNPEDMFREVVVNPHRDETTGMDA